MGKKPGKRGKGHSSQVAHEDLTDQVMEMLGGAVPAGSVRVALAQNEWDVERAIDMLLRGFEAIPLSGDDQQQAPPTDTSNKATSADVGDDDVDDRRDDCGFRCGGAKKGGVVGTAEGSSAFASFDRGPSGSCRPSTCAVGDTYDDSGGFFSTTSAHTRGGGGGVKRVFGSPQAGGVFNDTGRGGVPLETTHTAGLLVGAADGDLSATKTRARAKQKAKKPPGGASADEDVAIAAGSLSISDAHGVYGDDGDEELEGDAAALNQQDKYLLLLAMFSGLLNEPQLFKILAVHGGDLAGAIESAADLVQQQWDDDEEELMEALMVEEEAYGVVRDEQAEAEGEAMWQSLVALRKMFPYRDEESLLDALTACNYDAQAAANELRRQNSKKDKGTPLVARVYVTSVARPASPWASGVPLPASVSPYVSPPGSHLGDQEAFPSLPSPPTPDRNMRRGSRPSTPVAAHTTPPRLSTPDRRPPTVPSTWGDYLTPLEQRQLQSLLNRYVVPGGFEEGVVRSVVLDVHHGDMAAAETTLEEMDPDKVRHCRNAHTAQALKLGLTLAPRPRMPDDDDESLRPRKARLRAGRYFGEEYRREALRHQQAMHASFLSAATSYRGGMAGPAIAGTLSMSAKEHRLRSLECHAKAAAAFLKDSCPALDLQVVDGRVEVVGVRTGPGYIDQSQGMLQVDLHKLRVNEALQALASLLKVARRARIKVCRIIVGQGLHSKSGRARIAPAVQDLLRREGYKYDATTYVGVVDVFIT